MLRVGLDITPLGGLPTGVAAQCANLLRLIEGREDMKVRCFSTGRRRPVTSPELRHWHAPVPTRSMYVLWNILAWPKVDRLLGGVDVFHATNFFLPPLARAKGVLTIHDLAFLTHPEWSSPKITKPFARHIQGAVQRATLVIAASEATKRDCVRLLGADPAKVEVVYAGAPDDLNALEPETARRQLAVDYDINDPFVLYVGTLEPRKNIEGLLDAFAALPRELPHKLVLAGAMGWRMESALHRLENDPALRGRVIRPGYVPRAHLSAFYGAASLFVFPSHYEGFGIPPLEAMRCGCPVLTSDAASLPEVVGEAGIMVPSKDTGALAHEMARILGEDTLRERMSANGLARAKRFTWEACAEATVQVYQRAAEM